MVGKIRSTITGLWPVLKPYIPKPRQLFIVVLAFLIGLVWSYALDPVVFYDADPSKLAQSWQEQWVKLVAESYDLYSRSGQSNEQIDQNTIILLRAVDDPQTIVSKLGLTQIQDLAAQAQANAPAAPQPSLLGSIRPWILGSVVLVVVAIISSLLYGFYINPMVVEPVRRSIRRRRSGQKGPGATQVEVDAIKRSREMAQQLAKEDAAAPATSFGPPVTRHVSMYFPGRSFDDSFAIEDTKNDDEFLGECGAVISETIGVGEQEKVAAIEVWLFDKDDFVRTLTGVFASEYAFNDPAIRSKLDPKGQVVLAQPGGTLTLETNTLRMQARIVDMTYGTGPLPANSYFEKLTVELQTWRKDGTAQPVASVPVAAPAAMPSYTPPPAAAPTFTPPPMPSAPLSTYTPPAAPPTTPPPVYGGSITPLKPPPMQPPPPPARDDDPFGGTGDWTPIG